MTDRFKSVIFTRTGDDGTTSLVSGKRIAKHDLRVEVYGTVDELISAVGLARCSSNQGKLELDARLLTVQEELMTVAAVLACEDFDASGSVPSLDMDAVGRLEADILRWTEELPALSSFVLPGGTQQAAFLHQCRTVCRRAERRMYELHDRQPIPDAPRIYVNRLSDWFFMAARWCNHQAGVADVLWQPRQRRE